MNKPTLLDLFCGAGGISHGFTQAGFQVIAGLDIDDDSLVTFRANHPQSTAMHVDISEVLPRYIGQQLSVAPGDIDCIVGGPPCQGFSKNKAFRHQNGVFVNDVRNYLYESFFKYIEYFQPKVVLFENVPEILTKVDGTFREAIAQNFDRLRYVYNADILMASEYGVPQLRKRAFFLARHISSGLAAIPFPVRTTRTAKRPDKRTPNSKKHVQQLTLENHVLVRGPTVWDAISDLHGSYAEHLHGNSCYACEPLTQYQRDRRGDNTFVTNHFPWPLTDRQLRRVTLLKEGQGQLHLPPELQTKNGYGSAYRRLQSDAVALTITTWMFHPGSGMFTHPFENRVITIREAARLQSFQDQFVFFGNYHSQCRQVGNAVAPLVARRLAEVILEVL